MSARTLKLGGFLADAVAGFREISLSDRLLDISFWGSLVARLLITGAVASVPSPVTS